MLIQCCVRALSNFYVINKIFYNNNGVQNTVAQMKHSRVDYVITYILILFTARYVIYIVFILYIVYNEHSLLSKNILYIEY